MTDETAIGWVTKNSLYRYRPLLIALEWGFFVIGSLFWVDAYNGSGGFSESAFGAFALMFPAEMWAALMACPAMMLIVGLRRPIRNWMVVVAATISCANFFLLSYSAIFTGGEHVVGLFASILLLPLHLWILLEASCRAGKPH